MKSDMSDERWSHGIDRLFNSRYMEPGLADLIFAFCDGEISQAEFDGRFEDGPMFLSERWPDDV
jgi:hypothetical protein